LLTINLSPATLPKAGSHYDIAIVAAVLAAQGVFGAEQLRRTALLGEVGLEGRLRPVRGLLPATLAAQQAGFTRVIVPLRQAGEAQLVEGIEVFGIASITAWHRFMDATAKRRKSSGRSPSVESHLTRRKERLPCTGEGDGGNIVSIFKTSVLAASAGRRKRGLEPPGPGGRPVR
jgi:predicted ATPase with chaperone activity